MAGPWTPAPTSPVTDCTQARWPYAPDPGRPPSPTGPAGPRGPLHEASPTPFPSFTEPATAPEQARPAALEAKTMNDTVAAPGGSRPPLLLGRLAHRRLVGLADAAADRQPEFAQSLQVELARARLADDDALPDDVVAVGRRVEYFDHHAGRSRLIDLVWPPEADIDRGRVSVLTPIGAALIGLRVGQSIQWRVTDGSVRRLDVRAVSRAGDAQGSPASP